MKVLIVIVVTVMLLLLLPVGGDVSFREGELRLYVRLWKLRLCLFPRKPQKPRKPHKGSEDTTVSSPPKKPKKSMPNVTKDEVLETLAVLVGAVRKLRFRLHCLKLHFLSAFSDPYQTAMVFGYANAAVSALGLERLRQGDVQIGVDFQRETCYFDGYLSVTIRVWYVWKLAVSLLWGMVPILLSRRKRLKKQGSMAA